MAMFVPSSSRLCDRIFREYFLDPLECFFRRRLRRGVVFHNFGPGRLPDMLVLDLGIGRVRGPEGWYRRAEQTLLGVRRPVWAANHHRSSFTIAGIAGRLRPVPSSAARSTPSAGSDI